MATTPTPNPCCGEALCVCAAEDDDFGPEPDPALYRTEGADPVSIAAEQAGRRTLAALGSVPSWERWG